MIKTKKKLFLSFIFIIFISTVCIFSQDNFDNNNSNNNIEDINLDLENIDINLDEIKNLNDQISIQTKANPNILVNLIDVVANIQTPLWSNTKPPKGRDALYLIPVKLTAIEYGGILLNLFFNNTNKMDFSIDEALKLTDNQAAIDALEKVISDLMQENMTSGEVSSVIPLFKKISIQERKAGALLQAGFITGPFTFQLNTSFQVAERNFWLSFKDQEQLANMFQGDGTTFNIDEAYILKYGMGDTRLKAGLNTLNMSSFKLDLGLEGILPTSLISNVPHLKGYNINLENFENTFPDVLRSVRDNLLYPRLGNGGHFGLGCYTEGKLDLFHSLIQVWLRASFDNLFAAKEDRLIASKQTLTTPIAITDLLDEKTMTKFLKEFVFPPAYKVTVKPGGIFSFILAPTVNISKHWNIGFGYDYYSQQQEYFESVTDTTAKDDDPDIQASSLRIEDAEQPFSSQHKIFLEANYIKKYKKTDFNFGFGGDYTIASHNMGQDWTLFLRFGTSF
ncbi:hypothetical protein K9L05_02960 [Candidatus Babeliales bacterium]|nr:hypothetical protein [Candidatus Babeliales bacterium]MCF7899583.1 hypothetical protein [Candidatus Babeliales bacterium]